MSCKATRPFISREDAAFIRLDPLQSISTIDFEEYNDIGNNTFKRANITPELALQISNLIPDVIKLNPTFLDTLPALKGRLAGSQYINPFEIADLIGVAGFNGDDLYNELVNQQGETFSSDLQSFFEQLDFYYDEYLSIPYNPGRCEELYDIWQTIVQVELIVKTFQNWVARLRNFTLQELVDKLLDIEKLIKKFLKKLAERIKQRLIQLASEFLKKIEIFVNNVNQIVTYIQGKVTAITEYLSESNLEKIANDIGNEIKKAFGDLADFSISNIAYMLWRLCSLIESIKDFFKNPLALFQEGLITFTSAKILVEANTAQKRNAAAERGHIRVSPETANATRNQIRDDVNAANRASIARVYGGQALPSAEGTLGPSGLDTTSVLLPEGLDQDSPGGFVGGDGGVVDDPTIVGSLPQGLALSPTEIELVSPNITGEEAAWMTAHLSDADYPSEFYYTNGVKTMHSWTLDAYNRARQNPNGEIRIVTDNGPRIVRSAAIISYYSSDRHPYAGAGWKYPLMQRTSDGMCPTVMLRRTVLRMREALFKNYRFQVNSAYRHPIYDKFKAGGKGNGFHTSGVAFDISITSPQRMSLDEQIFLMYYANTMGFRRFGLYKTFIHVDTGPKNIWKSETTNNGITSAQRNRVLPAMERYFATGLWGLPT